ncbi:nitroreductase/quinone reductase family protein [Naasia lichenicola]|uniref:Nitroreductase family deazaflavin-dependent oxidoreductase n=1 Tax=Naasia lichenicola TaxID=2565933 RepID=A0A4S4FPC2_9MICO|nr:nitroreductase/quinone reductase family protein [Naasia lichenicola]THG32399.1 nitroreductase family deazaflavin-dependent oxidoreductase [Naasia lichenicola]
MTDWNDVIIEQFRANDGVVERFGDSLVIMHTVGAKTGEPRIKPVMGIRQPDGSWNVAATYAGNDRNPPWYHNLLAHPEIDLEAVVDGHATTVPVRVTELEGAERDAAWSEFTAASEGFRSYEAKTDRVFPVLRLSPREQG